MTIHIETDEATDSELRLINVQGQTVMTQSIALSKGQNTFSLSLEQLPSGLYFMVVPFKTAQLHLKISKL